MSDIFGEDADLLSEDYKKRDDDLDDDLDGDDLLYSSGDDENDELLQEPPPSAPVNSFSLSIPHQGNQLSSNANKVEIPKTVPSGKPSFNDSDSEGTDTRDETDDQPFDHDNSARKNIKIYRTISNVSHSNVSNERQSISEDIMPSTEDHRENVIEENLHDEDEESDEDERDTRERFKSERDGKISIGLTRTNAEKREIPDTLEISEEDKQKLEDFDKQEKERRFNRRFRSHNRGGNSSQLRFRLGNMGRGGAWGHRNQRQNRPLLGLRPPFQPLLQQRVPVPQPLFSRPPLNDSISLLLQRPPPPLPFNILRPSTWGVPTSGPRPPTSQAIVSSAAVHINPFRPPLFPPGAPVMLGSGILPLPQPSSAIPVVSGTNRDTAVESTKTQEEKNDAPPDKGNPIPTVMSVGQRVDSRNKEVENTDVKPLERKVLYERERKSPELSVKITRPRSRSSSRSWSRSPSPVPRNSKRKVLPPRRSRSPPSRSSRRRPKSQKRKSRRRSRSYSPKRRSRSRSPRRNESPAPRPGKILVNPHFKGARNLPTSVTTPAITAALSQTKTSVASTQAHAILPGIPPMLFSIPPPPLPGKPSLVPSVPPPSVLVPPPQISLSGTVAPPKVPPPISTMPPVRPPVNIPPPVNVAGPPPRPDIRVPPPTLPTRPRMDVPTVPPAVPPPNPTQSGVPPIPVRPHGPPPQLMVGPPPPIANLQRPPVADALRPPKLIPTNPPRGIVPSNMQQRPSVLPNPIPRQTQPKVFIRPILNDAQPRNTLPLYNKPRFETQHSSGDGQARQHLRFQGGNFHSNGKSTTRSRLKPPPTSSKSARLTEQAYVKTNIVETDTDYQAKLREQVERRKEILAFKAKRRGKSGPDTMSNTYRNTQQANIQGNEASGSCSVKISNLAAETTVENIRKLMKTVGPVEKVEYNQAEKIMLGVFKSSQHAKEFREKYNRHMLDLSYITINLV